MRVFKVVFREHPGLLKIYGVEAWQPEEHEEYVEAEHEVRISQYGLQKIEKVE